MKSPRLLLGAALLPLVASSAFATDGTYTTATTGGTWSTTTNWAGGIVAGGAGSLADLSTLNITADNTVNLSAALTLGTLKFADTTPSNKWILTGSAITFDNSGVAGVLDVIGTTPVPAANINVAVNAGTLGFTKTGTGTVDLLSGLSGAGLIKVSGGTLRLQNTGGATSFSGTYQVDAGATLSVGSGSTAGNLYNATVPAGAGVALNGGTLTFNATSSTRTLNAAVTGSGTVSSVAGVGFTQSGMGTIGGSVNVLISAGASTLSLANAYTGGTAVNGGTLSTGNTSALGTGAVTVGGGTLVIGAANLTGIASLTVNTGTLNTTAGAVTTTGAFALAGGTWRIGNTADGLVAASFTLTGGSIDLSGFSNKGVAGTYSLISGSGATSLTNSNFTNGAAGFTYSIDTLGDLTITAVPEPSTYALTGAGAFALAAFARRRRNRAG